MPPESCLLRARITQLGRLWAPSCTGPPSLTDAPGWPKGSILSHMRAGHDRENECAELRELWGRADDLLHSTKMLISTFQERVVMRRMLAADLAQIMQELGTQLPPPGKSVSPAPVTWIALLAFALVGRCCGRARGSAFTLSTANNSALYQSPDCALSGGSICSSPA